MEILAYGEDAITLWALKNKLPAILHTLKDSSEPLKCQLFFRPSFGRSGGENSPQFGEFDIIILSEKCIYLGESKWEKSSEHIQEGVLDLRSEQLIRHDIFRFYVEEWAFGIYSNWGDFEREGKRKLQQKGIHKPIAPEGRLLTANLRTVLKIIKQHFVILPPITNVLLYLHQRVTIESLPQKAGRDFIIVPLDYSKDTFDNFIKVVI